MTPIKWALFTKRTNDPKLIWVEAKLDTLGIPHRRNGESWHAPRLEVPEERLGDAWGILTSKHGDTTIDDLPDNHPIFMHYTCEQDPTI